MVVRLCYYSIFCLCCAFFLAFNHAAVEGWSFSITTRKSVVAAGRARHFQLQRRRSNKGKEKNHNEFVFPFSSAAFVSSSSSSHEEKGVDVCSRKVINDNNNHYHENPNEKEEVQQQQHQPKNDYGLSDHEFEVWVRSELSQDPLYEQYGPIFDRAAKAITNWRERYRGNPTLWRRLFKKDRVFKEFVEAVPIIDAVIKLIEGSDLHHYTIIDLASGKGYLSMFLSEMLSEFSDKVDGFVLMDKAWPRQNQPMKDHHISWEHIYGATLNATTTTINATGISSSSSSRSYQESWPIPLITSKQDLKQKCTHRTLQKRFFHNAKGPIILLAVHLCGTLSLRAVDMFNDNPETISFLVLKPCCLPPMVHAKRNEVFQIGSHAFDSSLVCSNGRFNGKRWYGPPRWHLINKFQYWAENLYLGVDIVGEGKEEEEGNNYDDNSINNDVGKKARVKVTVQQDGGYQNAFIFAERETTLWKQQQQSSSSSSSTAVWEYLQKITVSSFLEEK